MQNEKTTKAEVLGVRGLLPLLTKPTRKESLAPTAGLFRSARALAQNPRYPLRAHTLSRRASFRRRRISLWLTTTPAPLRGGVDVEK